MSEDRPLSALKESGSLKEIEKPKTNFSKARIEKIRKEFNESRHKFSKSKINEIRRNLYDIENENSLFESKIKEIERNLTELEEGLSKTKKYYDYDDIEYRGIRNVKDLFDLSTDEDYYKPIITKVAFNSNYIHNESKGIPHNTEKIRHAYKLKYNLNRENQVILLMITDGGKGRYLDVKSLSALFRGITGNNNGDFYCLNCFKSYATENKLKKHKKVCENHDYCYVEIPE